VYTSFTIERLRGIERLELTDLTQVNLISGRNSSGKSAVLEALFMHGAGPHAGELALNVLAPLRSGVPATIDPSGDSDPWISFFLNQNPENVIQIAGDFARDLVTVELTLAASRRAKGIVAYSQPGQTSPTYSIGVRVTKGDGRPREYVQTVGAQPLTPTTPLLGNLAFQFSALNFNLEPPAEVSQSVLVLAGRARTPQQELARRFSNLKLQGRDGDFLAAMRIIEPRLRSIEVLISNNQPALHADIGIGSLLPLQLLGEGTVILADIMIGIFTVRNGVILIDEIENGVHYSILEDFWYHIGRAARQARVQVFATTHSRECVIAAHTALSNWNNHLSLLRLIPGKERSAAASVVRYDHATLESALDLELDVR
jgi:hypothetical protein